jgi:hypothetical protein
VPIDVRTQALATAAQRAGLQDPALLDVAKVDVSPHAAVQDLRRRFPGAFKSALSMTAVEADELERTITGQGWSYRR